MDGLDREFGAELGRWIVEAAQLAVRLHREIDAGREMTVAALECRSEVAVPENVAAWDAMEGDPETSRSSGVDRAGGPAAAQSVAARSVAARSVAARSATARSATARSVTARLATARSATARSVAARSAADVICTGDIRDVIREAA